MRETYIACFTLLFLAAACGSKNGLEVPWYERDASVSMDAGRDGGRDGGRDSGPDVGPDGGPEPDECIELPYRDPPREVEVSFFAQILSAEVYFLVDVTGSMGEEIEEIRATVREDIIPGLAEEIPDVRFSVAQFADIPVAEYGELSDDLYLLLQPSTRDVYAVQRAVDGMALQGGRDGPEAMVEALYLSATGQRFGTYVPPPSCPSGTVGYPCFGEHGSRIFLTFTDAPSHNGPGGSEPYFGVYPEPHSYEQAVNALRAIGAKVLGLYSGGIDGGGEADLSALARDTGAIREDGTPLVFDIGRSGRFLAPLVVEAVRTLVEEVPMDVDAIVEDVPGDDFDAESFVEDIIALRAEPPEGAVNLGDRFDEVRPGTRVFFRVMLANGLIPQTDRPQSFLMRVVLRGDGVTRVQETLIRIVVPALGGGGCEAF